jgi:hypothetical protein
MKFKLVWQKTEKEPCCYCGYGETTISFFKSLTNGRFYKKTAWSGCLTYSERDQDLEECDAPVIPNDEQIYEFNIGDGNESNNDGGSNNDSDSQ